MEQLLIGKNNKSELKKLKGIFRVGVGLDNIDTEYFIHHGFIENSQKSNAIKKSVKYFFLSLFLEPPNQNYY